MKFFSKIHLQYAAVIVVYAAIACTIAALMQCVETGGWSGVDAERFHYMARMIVNGFAPYVSFVDPKPPTIYFVVAVMDSAAAPGVLDIPVVTGINILCALLIFYIGNREYGYISGFFAGDFTLSWPSLSRDISCSPNSSRFSFCCWRALPPKKANMSLPVSVPALRWDSSSTRFLG